MKVVVRRKWSHRPYQVMAVEHAFTPDQNDHERHQDGINADVRDLQAIVGRLIAHMFEAGTLSLEEGQRIVGLHGCEIFIHEPGTYGED